MMVLVSKSTLYSCAWDGTFQKLLLTVQKDILLVGDDYHALPGLPGEWVCVGGGHRHGVVHLLALVVQQGVSPQGILLAVLLQGFQMIDSTSVSTVP